MARPPKKPEDRKTHHLRVPVTDAQRQIVEEAIKLEGLDFAEWARAILLDAAKRVTSKHARQKGDSKA